MKKTAESFHAFVKLTLHLQYRKDFGTIPWAKRIDHIDGLCIWVYSKLISVQDFLFPGILVVPREIVSFAQS